MFEKIRALATKLGMKNPEKANVGVVIGFIVTAIVLAIGVVKTLVLSKETVSTNPLSGAVGHPRDCKYIHMVYHAVKFGHNYSERLFTSQYCADSDGCRWDTRCVIYARREPESVIPTHSIVC